MASILLIEDEKNLGITLEEYLNSIGHQCHWATTVQEARRLFLTNNFNIILFDIGLPDGNGIELAREFKTKRKDFSFLFLSALNDPEIKVQGLEVGAEDYITKPFALKELIIRLNRILKNQNDIFAMPDELIHGPLKIWFKRFEVMDALGNIIQLSQKECAILELLYKKKNEAVTRDEIIESIWGDDKFPSNRTVDNYIVKLRKWCETDLSQHIEIQSIRSIGYKLIIK